MMFDALVPITAFFTPEVADVLWWWIGGGAVAAAALATLVWCLRRRPAKPAPLPAAAVVPLLAALGGRDNVASVRMDGGRVAFVLNNLKAADLAMLKTLGATGVFVAGATVKALFPFDAAPLVAALGKQG
jgi:phosphotransferase system IIB component